MDEEEGVEAIQFLQGLAGIKESKEAARKGWSRMTDEEKSGTEKAYRIFYDLVKKGDIND